MLALPRIVEINTPGRRVRLDRGFLAIAEDAHEIGRIGIDTITAVVATTPAVSFTGQALAAVAEQGALVPRAGKVDVLFFTDKQYGAIRVFRGVADAPPPRPPKQLELF